jgi:osmotically inducible protein OsmC
MAQVRRATAHWSGDLPTGSGSVSTATTKAFASLPTSWRARAEADDTGQTSPEELLAAAHASCFSMAISNTLAKAGTPPERVNVSVEVTADKRDPGFTVLSSHITVRGRVPGIDQAGFEAAATSAKDGCPISRALQGNVELSVTATLDS